MKRSLFFLLIAVTVLANAQSSRKNALDIKSEDLRPRDWLIHADPHPSRAYLTNSGKCITLTNGLLVRSFILQPNAACIDFQNLTNGEQLLRAVKPEARIVINGDSFNIGGLYGQKQLAYLLSEWPDQLHSNDRDFQYESYTISDIPPYLKWKSRSWIPYQRSASGKMLSFIYRSGATDLKGMVITIHYELYDNIPLIGKWLSVANKTGKAVHLNQVIHEILATPEEESAVEGSTDKMLKPHGLYLESNFAFNNSMTARNSDQTTHWKTDTAYTSQVNYSLKTPCLLEVYPEKGIGIDLLPGDSFHSIRTYELLLDGYDRERNGLAQKRMYRTIAPWSMANPIFMHLISNDPVKIKSAVDQCAETGYEGIILSFGSGMNLEDTSAKNILQAKELAAYAHSRGILLGGYSLFSSRSISPEDDIISAKTGKPGGAFFGQAPCLGSNWGLGYLSNLKYFFDWTGFDIFENDGPYPGDVCASKTHPGHKGLEDSQWKQMELQKDLYHWLNERGVYINAPDWYFLDGTNKTALGYREVNFSLPREQQILLNRQNIYDGTWEKTPSMGWGFVPLTQYQGGGAPATLEPLHEHLDAYEQLMMQYYGSGIQACYRGPRLYDTSTTKGLVKRVINWYKKYRDILNADIIHLRRPDGRDWDGIIHVAAGLKDKALVMLYNPLPQPVSRTIQLPLYYTGIKDKATVRIKEGITRTYNIDREYRITVKVNIPAKNYTWMVIR